MVREAIGGRFRRTGERCGAGAVPDLGLPGRPSNTLRAHPGTANTRSPWERCAEQLTRVPFWLLITDDHDTISIVNNPAK